jgi:hypothetical protein
VVAGATIIACCGASGSSSIHRDDNQTVAILSSDSPEGV